MIPKIEAKYQAIVYSSYCFLTSPCSGNHSGCPLGQRCWDKGKKCIPGCVTKEIEPAVTNEEPCPDGETCIPRDTLPIG